MEGKRLLQARASTMVEELDSHVWSSATASSSHICFCYTPDLPSPSFRRPQRRWPECVLRATPSRIPVLFK